MRKNLILTALVGLVALSASAMADTSNSSLYVTGYVNGSISLSIENAGGNTFGLGTANATSELGAIGKFESAPTGFTLSRGAWNWTLSSTIGVKVDRANLFSPDYTLTARLGSFPANGIRWALNGSTLSDSMEMTLTSTGEYDFTRSFSWDIEVDDSAQANSIDNTILLTAISN